MSSLAMFGRLSARLASRTLAKDATVSRGFRTSAASLAAQNFTMPALSPTMTEGNIATWRVKEGDKFSAGDVLLEIETDKATMDVEAQEEGVLFKITRGDGSKNVAVGARIAVIAEEGDNLASLEIPPEETSSSSSSSSSSSQSAPPEPIKKPEISDTPPQSTEAAPKPKKVSGGKRQSPIYPLLPSVAHLVKEKGLDEKTVAEMTPTGPNGRLLKGDVLAYLGAINQDTPSRIASRFEHLSHLDLSNVKVAAPKPAPAAAKKPEKEAAVAAPPTPPQESLIALPVSLVAAIETQKKIEKNIGVLLPLSTFISRATDLANDDLPALGTGAKPTADELFEQIVSSSSSGRRHANLSRGYYIPQISAVAPAASVAKRASSSRKVDIIDILASGNTQKKQRRQSIVSLPGLSTGVNTFSLRVPKAEEKRARVFLERVKLVLENEPGRLVL